MDKSFDLKETRNNLVAKDNKMIQNSRFALSAIENKAVLYLISKIQPTDEPGKRYFFNCKEFQSLIKWNGDASYQNIKGMLTKLSSAQWWIDIDDENEALVRWFNIVHMNKGTGNIEISFHEDMFPFLLELQKQKEIDGHFYTTYKLQNVTLMKHRYSPRIYELLKSYQYNNRKWTFENGTGSKFDIQIRIADTELDSKTGKSKSIIPDSWFNWAIFKRDVLDPAVKEINKYTDIKVAYEGKKEDMSHKKTRAIRTIEFYMVGKTDPEQRVTDGVIDAEYMEIEDEQRYHQMSIEEAFFQEHEEKLEAERLEKEIIEEERREKAIESSKHPILASCLEGAFSEKEIDSLYNAAIKERVAGIVKFTDWEMYATDFVTHYYDLIKATPGDTKTTVYKRLLDMVRKDYDLITVKLQERYSNESI